MQLSSGATPTAQALISLHQMLRDLILLQPPVHKSADTGIPGACQISRLTQHQPLANLLTGAMLQQRRRLERRTENRAVKRSAAQPVRLELEGHKGVCCTPRMSEPHLFLNLEVGLLAAHPHNSYQVQALPPHLRRSEGWGQLGKACSACGCHATTAHCPQACLNTTAATRACQTHANKCKCLRQWRARALAVVAQSPP